MLRQDRDLVILQAPSSRLRKYDVALYRRGDKYVLHRVIGVEKDHYLIRGDNTYVTEYVPDRDVIGVLTSFKRKGKQYGVTDAAYLRYVRFWQAIYPLRRFGFRCRRVLVSIAGKSGMLPLLKRLLKRQDT